MIALRLWQLVPCRQEPLNPSRPLPYTQLFCRTFHKGFDGQRHLSLTSLC